MKKSEQKSEIRSRKTFVGVAALAREVGLSSPSVTVKLQRGMTPDDIRAEQAAKHPKLARGKQRNKGKERAGAAGSAAGSKPVLIRDDAQPKSLLEERARKEFHLANEHQIKVALMRGDLAPTRDIQGWVIETASHLLQQLSVLPSLLCDQLAGQSPFEVSRVLEHAFRSLVKDAGEHSRASARRHGLPTPPRIVPSPPPSELVYYRRYARDAIDGKLENNPVAAQLGSYEWRQRHPSVGDQENFELMRKEKRWNADMAALLRRRAEWDLPSEVEPDATATAAKTDADE